VRKRGFHRWFAVLGMVAMLGALVALPMTTSTALAMATPTAAAAAADHMPCHKPVKPCPHCPQKVCADMGSCLVKCFHSVFSPVGESTLFGLAVTSRVPPALSQVASGSRVPPLLRPPSV
jgi:hypothetical protein